MPRPSKKTNSIPEALKTSLELHIPEIRLYLKMSSYRNTQPLAADETLDALLKWLASV